MGKHFHFDLGDMPPIGWGALITIIAMIFGKLFLIDWLFNLGAIGLGAVVVMIVLALINEFL